MLICSFLLFFLFLVLLLIVLFHFLLCLLVLLFQKINILLQISQSVSCSLGVLFIVVDVVVELDQFDVLFESPFSEAVSVEIELIPLEVQELFVDEVQMFESRCEVSLFEERLGCFDNIPMVLKFI